MTHRYEHTANHVFNQPWAILPSTMGLIVEVLRYRMAGGKYTPEEIEERTDGRVAHLAAEIITPEAAGVGSVAAGGSVAVLQLYGVIAQRMNVVMDMSGGTSTEIFGRQFQMVLVDPTISAIVMQVDSPGGSVFGVEELATMIYKARGQKKLIAVADSMAASAAFWIATAMDEVWVTPGGMVGSVGVIAEHYDMSQAYAQEGISPTLITFGEHKAEGNDTAPLTDEATTEIQRMVDSYGMSFVKGLARQRGVSTVKVMNDFGQGRVYRADEAVQRGMADKVGTLTEAIRSALGPGGRGGGRKAQYTGTLESALAAEREALAQASPEARQVATRLASYAGPLAQRQPYEADPGETVKCPACGEMNSPDANYCDQCGVALPDSAFLDGREPYKAQPDETVECPACGAMNENDAKYCDQCGELLPDSAFAAALVPPVNAEAERLRRELDILTA